MPCIFSHCQAIYANTCWVTNLITLAFYHLSKLNTVDTRKYPVIQLQEVDLCSRAGLIRVAVAVDLRRRRQDIQRSVTEFRCSSTLSSLTPPRRRRHCSPGGALRSDSPQTHICNTTKH